MAHSALKPLEQRGLGEQDGKEEASDKGVRGSLAQRQALSRALRAEYDSTCEKWRQDISVEEGGTRCCRAQRTGLQYVRDACGAEDSGRLLPFSAAMRLTVWVL